jgi:hydroxyethylthiazole kinase-like uncharacterized protein yjeF
VYDRIMDLKKVRKLLYRDNRANKYDFGHVLVVGGSPGMTGAPLLSGMAALRTGAGLVTIASSPAVVRSLERRVKEIMTLALPSYDSDSVPRLLDFIDERQVATVAIGPGLKRDAFNLVRSLVSSAAMPVVLDAGALDAYGGRLEDLRTAAVRNRQIILTPHTGEYARLFGSLLPEAAAVDLGVTIIVKSHRTKVFYPDNTRWQNTTGNPGMATSGSGDVLSGVIAGLLAQGLSVRDAVETGVYLHGYAGDMAATAKTQPGMIASDIITFLPEALRSLDRSKK